MKITAESFWAGDIGGVVGPFDEILDVELALLCKSEVETDTEQRLGAR